LNDWLSRKNGWLCKRSSSRKDVCNTPTDLRKEENSMQSREARRCKIYLESVKQTSKRTDTEDEVKNVEGLYSMTATT